ncbi:MAG: VWA domain-containing protein [Cyanobacteria bacterium REEB65]|nr:VWA domain-containing protein [Cyanobacteria bacterium REEB65]
MPLEVYAKLSDDRIAAAAQQAQRMLYVEVSALPDSDTLPLNLALVLDKSGSMEDALPCLKGAATHVIGRLSEQDRIAVVAFGSEPEVLVPSQLVADQNSLRSAVLSLEAEGGTCLDEGIAAGLAEVRRSVLRVPAVRGAMRMFLLTDGYNRNGDDDRCMSLAREAAKEGIAISTFGIGADLNVGVLREVANAGNGMLHYVPSPLDIGAAFAQELQSAAGVIATDVQLHVRLGPGCQLGDRDPVCLIQPAVVLQAPVITEAGLSIRLGDLCGHRPLAVLVTLYLDGRTVGEHEIATIELSHWDSTGRAVTPPAAISASWMSDWRPQLEPRIETAMARAAIYKQRQKAIAVASSDPKLAQTLLQNATQLAGQTGAFELQTVLQRTAEELRRDHRVSDRTFIEGEVASRTVLP